MKPVDTFFKLEDFVPSLKEALRDQKLDLNKVIPLGIQFKESSTPSKLVPAPIDRKAICLTDGKNTAFWEVESLLGLFRGNKQPPVLGDYPEAYNDCFIIMDLHALEFSNFLGNRRDAEMKEIYSTLRRRPDGKSMGLIHDYMWQAAALVLGTHLLSQAEFEAIMERLERSCRTFEMGPTSQNYVITLKETFGQASRVSPSAPPPEGW
jgi:hypothetical protein